MPVHSRHIMFLKAVCTSRMIFVEVRKKKPVYAISYWLICHRTFQQWSPFSAMMINTHRIVLLNVTSLQTLRFEWRSWGGSIISNSEGLGRLSVDAAGDSPLIHASRSTMECSEVGSRFSDEPTLPFGSMTNYRHAHSGVFACVSSRSASSQIWNSLHWELLGPVRKTVFSFLERIP